MRLGIVIPAFKENANLLALISAIRSQPVETEIVIVDDSPDLLSVEVVEQMNQKNLLIIHRDSKGGRGSAVIEGLRYLLKGQSEFILEMDADFSHPPSQIPEMLAEAKNKNLDLVIASRYLAASRIENWPLSRKVFSWCANHLARSLLGVPVSDYTNGFRIYSRPAAQEIVNTCGKFGHGFIALSEILVNLFYRHFRIGEIPTVFVNRTRGESSLSLKEISGAVVGLGKILRHKNKLCSEQGRRR